MPVGITSGILLALLFFLLSSGLYVGVALAGVGVFGLEFLADAGGIIGGIIYNSIHSYTLAAVPLFLFMGEIVLRSGLSGRLYRGVSKWTRVIPGGLTHSNIVSCSFFAAISGSSVATAATIGTVAYPEQTERGYHPVMVTGSLAAGGTLGILIPPSITMIIYGAYVGESVGRLFAGGIIPGIILAFMFMIYIFFAFLRNPSLGPSRESVRPWRYFIDSIVALKDIWPTLLLIVLIMGSIYGGVMTPTEAAAMSCFLALLLAATVGKLNLAIVKESALGALQTTAMAMFVFMGARILGQSVSMLKIPAQLSQMVAGWEISPMWIWLMVIIMYLILGCFMDGISMMLLSLPITYPLMITTLGFNSVWFGVMVTILVECALVTPPVGMNLYVIHGIAKGISIGTIIRGIIPFFILMLVALALYTFVPNLVLFLPARMIGG